jgi:hypothetical protein
MTASRRSALLKSAGRWVLNKEDLVFMIWGGVWMIWLAAFVALYSQSWLVTAAVFGILSFIPLWWAFCRSLDGSNRDR